MEKVNKTVHIHSCTLTVDREVLLDHHNPCRITLTCDDCNEPFGVRVTRFDWIGNQHVTQWVSEEIKDEGEKSE